MEEVPIVAVVLEFQGKFFVGKRAPWMKFQPNLWAGVAGRIEENESVKEAALRETKEETNLNAEFISRAKPFENIVQDRKLLVHPVLCKVKSINGFKLSREHIAFKWINANELWDLKIVPTLEKDFELLGIGVGKPVQKKLGEF